MISTHCDNSPEHDPGGNSAGNNTNAVVSHLNKTPYQQAIDGVNTDLYVLKNKNGMQAAITNYGARLVSLSVPETDNKLVNVVVGFNSVLEYQSSTEPYYGATIGRYGNRIAKGKFTLDGLQYLLAVNNGINALHGGKKGFQYVVWEAKQIGDSSLELHYLSKDMEEGYPGNLKVKVTYNVTDNDELKLEYEAVTDKKTVINFTNHAFFNLNGEGSGTINNHLLMINANNFLPVDITQIPTGNIEAVANTPFDFRDPVVIAKNVDANDIQIKNGKGYDHCFVLNVNSPGDLTHAATVTADKSNIVMDVYTQEPGIQFYGGNCMQSENTMRGGGKDDFRTAFCLETQHFPDSPNQPGFPSTILEPGKIYQTSTIYKFTLKK